MTVLDLDAIKARADAATQGAWSTAESQHYSIIWGEPASIFDPVPEVAHVGFAVADAEFIAHARTDVPALVAEVERLRIKLAVIRGIGANSGTDLNAWNKAFDVIEDALRGPSDSSSTGSEL